MSEVDLGARAAWILFLLGGLSGAVSLYTFRRWSDGSKLRLAVNRVLAHLLELRLFVDEPERVLRTQLDLLAANAVLLRQMIGPSLLLIVPFAVLFLGVEACFSLAPLPTGEPAIVTVQCQRLPANRLPELQLGADSGIRIETPPVRIVALSQVSWRVRPIGVTRSHLTIRCQGSVIQKSISSGRGLQWLSEERAGTAFGFLLHPLELPFSARAIESVSVRYPNATVLHINWLIWFSTAFLAGSVAYAIALSLR